MMTWTYVTLAMFGAALIGLIVSFFLMAIEKPIQWGGRSGEEWQSLGVECPGERLRVVSFIFGAASTTISRSLMYLAGTWVFLLRKASPSILPMVVVAFCFVINDVYRVQQFRGNSGQPTELGYFCGGIVAFAVFLWFRTIMI